MSIKLAIFLGKPEKLDYFAGVEDVMVLFHLVVVELGEDVEGVKTLELVLEDHVAILGVRLADVEPGDSALDPHLKPDLHDVLLVLVLQVRLVAVNQLLGFVTFSLEETLSNCPF